MLAGPMYVQDYDEKFPRSSLLLGQRRPVQPHLHRDQALPVCQRTPMFRLPSSAMDGSCGGRHPHHNLPMASAGTSPASIVLGYGFNDDNLVNGRKLSLYQYPSIACIPRQQRVHQLARGLRADERVQPAERGCSGMPGNMMTITPGTTAAAVPSWTGVKWGAEHWHTGLSAVRPARGPWAEARGADPVPTGASAAMAGPNLIASRPPVSDGRLALHRDQRPACGSLARGRLAYAIRPSKLS